MPKRGRAVTVGPPLDGAPRNRWHAETLVCAFSGHRAPAAWVRDVDAKDALVALRLVGGGHVGRCLRCDAWVLADPTNATGDRLDEHAMLDGAAMPRRGKDLRDAIVLRLIALDRAVHATAFGLVALALFVVETRLPAVQGEARKLLFQVQRGLESTGQDTSRGFVVHGLQRVLALHRSGLRVLLGTAVAYAAIEGVEAVGLWRQRRWAEYLTAVATAGFLPLEIHELLKKVTVTRALALGVNLVVLAYLMWAKHLFGLRGGMKADAAELEAAERLPTLPGQPL